MSGINKLMKVLFDADARFLALSRRGFYNKLSDQDFLQKLYKARLGKELNLEKPQTFNEKIQWLKVYDHNPLYTDLSDKYEVKNIIADIIGEEHIIKTYGVWDRFEDIDFDALPKQFVLKCTHDSGGIIICRDKDKLDIEAACEKINKCLKVDYYSCNREWCYKNIKRRIIAEEYMEEERETGDENMPIGLIDYKFFCMNGKPEFLYVSKGLEDHSTARISFVDFQGKELPFYRADYKPFGHDVELPSNIEEMRETAEKLAEFIKSPFVRIDLYSLNNTIYFSEVTFYPCSGLLPFKPEEWDLNIGKTITLPCDKVD